MLRRKSDASIPNSRKIVVTGTFMVLFPLSGAIPLEIDKWFGRQRTINESLK